MNAKTVVHAGVCGFTSTIIAMSEDSQNVVFTIETDCDKIKALGTKLPPVDAYMEIGTGFDGELLKTVRENLGGCCAGCVVPSGIFKTMQVAAGLALPRDIHLEITRID